MFVALYLPATTRKSPSIAGFRTEKCAWDYIFDSMCKSCREERNAALRGDKTWGEDIEFEDGHTTRLEPSLYPGCACEWDVLDESEFTPEQLEHI